MLHWIYLSIAIILELAGTVTMKLANGLEKWGLSLLMLIFYGGSLTFLTLALKNIEISIAYAIWSGMGIVLITGVGFLYFKEEISIVKVIAILFILIGVITLNITSGEHEAYKNEKVVENR